MMEVPSQKNLAGLGSTLSTLIEGIVQKVLYVSPLQEYAVIQLELADKPKPLVVVGAVAHAREGETLRVEGRMEEHPTHGTQLRAEFAIPKHPETQLGLERYLATLKGFGPQSAYVLMHQFGMEALHVLENESWRVAQVKKIGKKRAQSASEDAKQRRDERELMIFLQSYGISSAYATRIGKAYGEQALFKVRENPYRLARDVPGIGFAVADQIAKRMGVAKDASLRMEAGIWHALHQALDQGHCYLPMSVLLKKAQDLLKGTDEEPSLEALTATLEALETKKEVMREPASAFGQPEDSIYLAWIHHTEFQLAKSMYKLSRAKPHASPVLPPNLAQKASLSASQLAALQTLLPSSVGILTGGPGTGKTTLLRTLVALHKNIDRQVLLLAPTGRAAKRLSEATGHPASTLHRALEWNPGQPIPLYKRILEADFVVCDEVSMVDVHMMAALVQAVPTGATLLLVGDTDQLPSIGPGRVLKDLIDSNVIPVAQLTEVFRQGEGSGIVQNAHRVLEGLVPISATQESENKDFYFIEHTDPKRVQEIVVALCTKRIPGRFGFDPIQQIQVLTPIHKGEAGTVALNQALQSALNPKAALPEFRLETGMQRFCVGDKVMQVRNDYDRDVWNGDIGVVVSVNTQERNLMVQYDEVLVLYKKEQLDQLELAYAISVHKSQGSEYPAVVIPVLWQHAMMLQRNLLYTALTRGRKLVILVGTQAALQRAVREKGQSLRYTHLTARLQQSKSHIKRS